MAEPRGPGAEDWGPSSFPALCHEHCRRPSVPLSSQARDLSLEVWVYA